MDEREFPEAPMLMHMLGLFGDVRLGEIEEVVDSIKIVAYARDVFLDSRHIGILGLNLEDGRCLYYDGKLPCRKRESKNRCTTAP